MVGADHQSQRRIRDRQRAARPDHDSWGGGGVDRDDRDNDRVDRDNGHFPPAATRSVRLSASRLMRNPT